MEKKPLRDFGMIKKNDYVGKSYSDAKQYAEDGGFNVRVVERDGVSEMLPMDTKSDRLNFRLSNNIVSDVFGGQIKSTFISTFNLLVLKIAKLLNI